jgi:hypothetical protein
MGTFVQIRVFIDEPESSRSPAKDEVVDMTGVAADDPGAADAANDTAARPVSQPVPVSAAS